MSLPLKGLTDSLDLVYFSHGEVAEWFKAVVLKTIERKFRGFESLLLRRSEAQAEDRRKEGFERPWFDRRAGS